MNRTLVGAVAAFATFAFVMTSAAVGLSSGAAVHGAQSHNSAAAVGCGQSMLNLGAAAHFRVLAGTTVTSTGLTVVHGNLGVSPGTSATGFGPGRVVGSMQIANNSSAAGEAALLTAYNNGSGRTNCAINVSGNLGGSTLRPGLYVSTSGLAISSGSLTLDAHGHPNAVFIFQMATTFTTATSLKVILAGGANATHIFWIVGSSATLGISSTVYGNILAYTSITLDTSATVHGRTLAMNGAVTLDAGHVRK